MNKEIDINDPFLAEKEAIRYMNEFEDGDKFSFTTGFKMAMKLVKESDNIDLVSDRICNWVVIHKNTGIWVKYENLHINQMLDKVMMLEDGDLSNYEIYEHSI